MPGPTATRSDDLSAPVMIDHKDGLHQAAHTPEGTMPYHNQRAMDQALKDTPGLTEEKFKEESDALGF